MRKKNLYLIKDFSVGVPEIDAQHGHLISLIGCLSGMCRKRVKIPDLDFAIMIKQNLYFINYHIKYEEKLIEETAYPELENFKNFHNTFFMNLIKQIRAYESRNCFIPEKLPRLLYEWLDSHLLMDLDISFHLKNQKTLAS